jgi:hypothetical protein
MRPDCFNKLKIEVLKLKTEILEQQLEQLKRTK